MSKKRVCLCSCVCLLALLPTAQADLLTDWEAAISTGTPLHWYKFNETSGTDCKDSGSGKLDGTYDGVQLGQEGFLGPASAAGFDRSASNRVDFAGAANLTGPWTVEYVVMTTKPAAANDSMALHDSDTTSVRLAGWTSVGEAGFTLYGVADYQFTPAAGRTLQDLVAPKDTWIHLAFRRSTTGTQVFFNGELLGTSASTIEFPRLRIGAHGVGPADMLQGALDEAVIYDRALSDSDILAHASLLGLAPLKARNPSPVDGDLAVVMPLLQWSPGLGAQLHTVYLGTTPDLSEANLVASRTPVTMYYMALGLQPGTTYYWRVDEIEKNGTTIHGGDVWTFTAQGLAAYHPDPADGAVDAAPAPVLTWLPGQATLKHHVYFGIGSDAVSQGAADVDQGEVEEATFTPGDLESIATYHWRVDELVVGGTVVTGPVWSFTTFLLVDDFESYNDDEGQGTRIYETWIDGYADGSSGSTVGNTQPPFAEQTIIHGGLQSMPLDYNNVNPPFYSEAVREFSPVQDWTLNAADTLVLYVRGRAANGVAPLYLAIEDASKHVVVIVYPDPAVVTTATWTAWKVPFSELAGVNMAGVKKMYIGLGDRDAPTQGGAGRIYFDDIRVIRAMP
jgi:hypothetical protein